MTELDHVELELDDGDAEPNHMIPPSLLPGLLKGISSQGFTGSIEFNDGHEQKKLYFRNGRVVFASSSQIDDRLGEVLYRNGTITLDQLTEAAVQVTAGTKFGHVLLESGIMRPIDLWQALSDQVYAIMQSVFFMDCPEISFDDGSSPFTCVDFDGSTPSLVERCHAYSLLLKNFIGLVNQQTSIEVTNDADMADLAGDTFYHDIFTLVESERKVAPVLAKSQLQPINVYGGLLHLCMQGRIEIKASTVVSLPDYEIETAGIRAAVTAYDSAMEMCRGLFEESGVQTPIEDIQAFCERLFHTDGVLLFVDRSGDLDNRYFQMILKQAQVSQGFREMMIDCIRRLRSFLLQMSMDKLPGEWADQFNTAKKRLAS